VGAEPETFGITVPIFHRRNIARLHAWPHSMLATSTHDTKRSEDVRARINVLSEMPLEWYRAVARWQKMNRAFKTDVNGREAPSANEAYLLYQTLVGTWPLQPMARENHTIFVDRMQSYMEKALHEAKVHTSWVNPNREWDEAVRRFVSAVLEDTPENRFLADFREFQEPVTRAGLWNALSQVLLKIASPGVPDFYQGNERWTFTLVDPDNRGAVDYAGSRDMLRGFEQGASEDRPGLVRRLAANLTDGAAKLYLTNRALRFRRDHGALFSDGAYASLLTTGARANHAIAFARIGKDENVLALAGRFFLNMTRNGEQPLGADAWADTEVLLPRRFTAPAYTDVISGRTVETVESGGKRAIRLADAFAIMPQALLYA
jgi:(1->4)-alpha-D-glucan 1-alpha-D-glucosylmutase